MWLLPTYGRPERCQATIDSIIEARCSTPGIVLVDGSPGYDELRLPEGWRAVLFGDNKGQLARLNDALTDYPDEPWYGIMHDDFIVVTPEWDKVLVENAGNFGIANANDGWNSSIHGGPQGSTVFGGDLMRALGWFSPPGIFHMGAEGAWGKIVATFRNWTYCPDTIVEHRHAWNDKAPLDGTYRHEYAKVDADRTAWDEFATGPEMRAAIERIAKAMGVDLLSIPAGVKLSICTPVVDGKVSVAYVHAREESMRGLTARGIDVSTHWGRERRSILRAALDAGATHIAFVGAERGWPPDLLLQLIATGHDMCGPMGKFEKVEDIDFGFALLRRDVAEGLQIPELAQIGHTSTDESWKQRPMQHPFHDLHTSEAIAALGKGVAAVYGYDIAGDIAEFGTCTGRTAEGLAQAIAACDGYFPSLRRRELHLFDSFEGFPAADNAVDSATPQIADGTWGPGVAKGLSPDRLLALTSQHIDQDRIKIVPGWYRDTVRGGQAPGKYALIHIDCDFYGSTMDVLTGLFGSGKVATGALLFFDDWSCNAADPNLGERRAWTECVKRFDIEWSDQMAYGIFARCVTIHSYVPDIRDARASRAFKAATAA